MSFLLYLSASLLFLSVYYYILPYFTSNSWLRGIPGPFFARFSNLWLLSQSRRGIRYLSVDDAHKRYGKIIRIQPCHVSIADDAAIPQIYGHGNGFLKSEYYDAFVTIKPSIFNTRDRAIHSRKRKVLSNSYSAASISKFEKYIFEDIQILLRQWDKLIVEANGNYATLDCLYWFNLIAFDIIGDLAFGKSFNMLETGKDITEIRLTPNDPPTYTPAVEVLNRRGEVSATLGCLPQLKTIARYFPDPFYSQGLAAVDNLTGIAIARVAHRLDNNHDHDRADLLARLMQSKDENGALLDRNEITTEALTQLIAGSDTTSNTSCGIMFWVLRTPHVLPKLRAELDAIIPEDVAIPTYDMVKDLPYLNNTIKESLRIHSTSSIGLPREVPPGPGVTVCSRYFPSGTVLSVPSYTIHHSPEIWGEDVEEFLPERWERLTQRQKSAFIPFSHGPRGCIGRNLAMMELVLIFATILRRWDFKLHTKNLETVEGFLRKPVECIIGVKQRVI